MNLRDPIATGIPAPALESSVAEIFVALGVPAEGARLIAQALVAAEMDGQPSHGLRLVPIYAERLMAGSVAARGEPSVVHDGGSAMVLDARHTLGHLTADWAMPMAIERARSHGMACVAVRNAFHFGAPGFWARQIAEAGIVGIVMSNTHPLRPAAAVALPSSEPPPYVVDLGEAGAGKDPMSAVAAFLLPQGGPAAQALAMTTDLLCGLLAGGAVGGELAPLQGDPSRFPNGAHLFLALDPARFGVPDLAERVARLQLPRRQVRPDECLVPPEVLAQLRECAAKIGGQ